MADNVTMNQNSSSGAVVATDEVASVHYQVVKLAHGADGSASLVSTSDGLPVQIISLSALPAGTNNIGDVDILTLPGTAAEGAALPALFMVVAGDDGTDTQPLQLNAAGDLKVTLDSETVAATQSGTWNIGTVTTVTTVSAVTSITSPVTVAQATAANLNCTEVNSGGIAVSLGLIDDSVTQHGTAYNAGNHKGLIIAGYDGANLRLVSTDVSGRVNVADGGSSLTVDGTVAATQSGTWNVGTVTAVTAISNALPAGTNNIGDVDLASALPAGTNNIGDVDLASAIPAGTNLIGIVSAPAETSTIYNGTTALTPKFVAVSASSSGDNTLLAAVASKKIRVIGGLLVAAGTVNVRFESGAGGTALTGVMPLVVNSGFQIPYSPTGNFETASNTLLNLELSGAVAVTGWLMYVEV